MMQRLVLATAAVLLGAALGQACSLCEGNAFLAPTFRQEAALPYARIIVHGTIANPRLETDGTGRTDFLIKTVLRKHPALEGKTQFVLNRYLPLEKGTSPHYLLFCDVDGMRIDPYRGVKVTGQLTIDYIKKALALDPKNVVDNLAFFFRYLDDADPEVGRDAFLEFAKAGDADIQRAAAKLDPARLRAWLENPKTPAQRIGVYALLLGACGKSADADWLRTLIDSKEERYANAADGLLGGYMQVRPREGWDLLHSILADGRKPVLLRLSVLRTMRFYQGARPKESRPQILRAMRTLLAQGELADLAIEDMRRWNIWDLGSDVVALYGKKGFDAPLMRRAILRYALCSPPDRQITTFLTSRRTAEPDEVKDVEEGLRLEKEARQPARPRSGA